MKYKAGDRVKIKSLDWYNENKNKQGNTSFPCQVGVAFTSEMSFFCGQIVTITQIEDIKDREFYHIREDKGVYVWADEMIEGLVERNGKTYPYKIGDRVVLKGNNRCATITNLKYNSWGNLSYYVKIDNDKDISIDYPTDLLLPYDNKVEGLVEEENNHLTETVVDVVKESNDRYRIVTDPRFDIEVDEGEYYAVRRKKEYPKTYEECCKVMNYCCNPVATKTTHKEELIRRFQFLLLYRDAYWKIAGDEMGLGKPWQPDWTNHELKYCTKVLGNTLKCITEMNIQCPFAFPTPEMRDAFKKNFDPDIEFCKELL